MHHSLFWIYALRIFLSGQKKIMSSSKDWCMVIEQSLIQVVSFLYRCQEIGDDEMEKLVTDIRQILKQSKKENLEKYERGIVTLLSKMKDIDDHEFQISVNRKLGKVWNFKTKLKIKLDVRSITGEICKDVDKNGINSKLAETIIRGTYKLISKTLGTGGKEVKVSLSKFVLQKLTSDIDEYSVQTAIGIFPKEEQVLLPYIEEDCDVSKSFQKQLKQEIIDRLCILNPTLDPVKTKIRFNGWDYKC